jgi:predicted nucleic acid-binding protein
MFADEEYCVVRVLLDTCVLSELQDPKGSAVLREAVEAVDEDDLFVSVISLGEIEKAIALLTESAKRRRLKDWLHGLESGYGERLLPIDRETSRIWGEITAAAHRRGRTLGAADGLIASTALRHGLHVMTRNVKDFDPGMRW